VRLWRGIVENNTQTVGDLWTDGTVELWSGISRLGFKRDRAATTESVFMLQEVALAIYCTDEVCDAVRAHGLIGFDIMKAWPSEDGPASNPARNSIASQFMTVDRRGISLQIKLKRDQTIKTLAARDNAEG
jgi:hypothetical protein